jgi:hypothetical protein
MLTLVKIGSAEVRDVGAPGQYVRPRICEEDGDRVQLMLRPAQPPLVDIVERIR